MAIKKLISPLQSWLLARDRCVGCGIPLAKAIRVPRGKEEKVTCKCGRIFLFDKKAQKYRRALLNEA